MKMLKFLSQFDYFLLRHHLHIWRTKAHYVLFFSIVAGILLFLLGYFYPMNMQMIAQQEEDIDNIRQLSFMLSVALAVFGIVAWQRKIARHIILKSNWKEILVELGLYALCLAVIWQAANAFTTGLNCNIVAQQNKINVEERKRLNEEFYFVPSMIDRDVDADLFVKGKIKRVKDDYSRDGFDLIRRDSLTDSTLNVHINSNIAFMKQYMKRAKTTPFLDSQMVLCHHVFNFKQPFSLGNIKERMVNVTAENDMYDWENTNHFMRFLVKNQLMSSKLFNLEYYESENILKKSWLRLSDNQKNRYKIFSDSLVSFEINEKIKNGLLSKNHHLLYYLSYRNSTIVQQMIDTCSTQLFMGTHTNYMESAANWHQLYNNDILEKRFWNSLNPKEKEAYLNYLSAIMQTFEEIRGHYQSDADDENLIEKEEWLYELKDSLYLNCKNHFDKSSNKCYADFLKLYKKHRTTSDGNYYSSNNTNLNEVKLRLWNTRNKRFMEGRNLPSKNGIDSILKVAYLLIQQENGNKTIDTLYAHRLANQVTGCVLGKNLIDNAYNPYHGYSTRFDTLNRHFIYYFYTVKSGKFKGYKQAIQNHEINGKNFYHYLPNYDNNFKRSQVKIDSSIITYDSLFKQEIQKVLLFSLDDMKTKNHSYFKSIFSTRLSDADSTLLRNILAKNGFLDDKTHTFNREYLLNSTYDLLRAEHKISVMQRYFFDNFEFLAWKKKENLLLVLGTLLLFVTTSASSNVFIALFASFFIVFFNFSIFKILHSLTQNDPNMPLYLSFGVLGLFALLCSGKILFGKTKSPFVHTLMLIQLISMSGILLFIFKATDVQQNHNYLWSFVALLSILALFYRRYLSNPSA